MYGNGDDGSEDGNIGSGTGTSIAGLIVEDEEVDGTPLALAMRAAASTAAR